MLQKGPGKFVLLYRGLENLDVRHVEVKLIELISFSPDTVNDFENNT